MALSVKLIQSDLDCAQPGFEIPVMYTATSGNAGAELLCNGGGESTNIYADFSTLSSIYSNSASANAGEGNLCPNGMDVVFVVDYTASMLDAINGVKSGIANLATEIASLSTDNYRLGLVLFDEYNGASSGVTPQYNSSSTYINLPATQKIVNVGDGHTQFFTCMEKMGINNVSSFTTQLNKIATNNSTGMSMGNGAGVPEPGGMAVNEVVTNAFAGGFRQDALKVVILITDAPPGGDNDRYDIDGLGTADADQPTGSSADTNYFNNVLIPAVNNANVQVFACTSQSVSSLYQMLAENTTPSGLFYNNLSYNSTWTTSLETGLADLCEETTVYTCDPAAAGWYAAAPVNPGDTMYYWNGTNWMTSYQCPVSLTLNIVDGMTGAGPDAISPLHPNYSTSTQYQFTGTPGTQFSVTLGYSPDANYEDPNLTGVSFSPSGQSAITHTNSEANEEVTFIVTMPSASSTTISATLLGSARPVTYQVQVTIQSVINDTTDINGDANTGPNGTGQITGVGSGWIQNNVNTVTKTFTGSVGATHNLSATINPFPSDYTFVANNLTQSVSGNVASSLSSSITNGLNSGTLSGTLTMPAQNGSIVIQIDGESNQPRYRYTLYSSDNITGGSVVAEDESVVFWGYTGDTFTFTSDVEPDAGYDSVTVTGATLNNAYGQNDAISGLTVTPSQTAVTGTVTMPLLGGYGGIIIAGSAEATQYTYTVTIQESIAGYSIANSYTFTGTEGQSLSHTLYPIVDSSEYNVNITGTSNSGPGLTSSANTSQLTLNLIMPAGGGTGTVTVNGNSSQVEHTFTINISESFSTGNYATTTVTRTGVTGSTHSSYIPFSGASGYTYSATLSESPASALVATLLSNMQINWSLTMPAGGGSTTLTLENPVETPPSFTWNVVLDNRIGNTQINVSNTNNGPFTGIAGSTHQFTLDLDPVGDREIAISGVNFGSTASLWSNVTISASPDGHGYDRVTGTLTMPSYSGQSTALTSGSSTLNEYDVTVNLQEYSADGSWISSTPDTVTGYAGEESADTVRIYTYSVDDTARDILSGFSAVTNQDWASVLAYTNIYTAGRWTGVQVQVDITIPMGGGTVNVTAQPSVARYIPPTTATTTTYPTFGCSDANIQVFDGTVGDVILYNIDAGSVASVSPSTYQLGNTTYTFQVVVPSSPTYTNNNSTITCTDTASAVYPTWGCSQANLQINSGIVGQPVTGTVSNGGTILSISPSTYQTGPTTYTANIRVPAGNWNNARGTVVCSDQVTATTTTTTTTTQAQVAYTAECVSGNCLQGTGTTVRHEFNDPIPIGAFVTLQDIGGCWEVLSSYNGTAQHMVAGLCSAPTTTTTAPPTTSTTTQSLRGFQ